jgi:hypothetical protein
LHRQGEALHRQGEALHRQGEALHRQGEALHQPSGRSVNRQMTRSYGMIRIHRSRVIKFPGLTLPDWRLAPMGAGWGDSVSQAIDDNTLRRMMEAFIRRGFHGSVPIVLLASVRRMVFRIVSESCSLRRCIGCRAEGREPSLASRLAGRLTRSGQFGLWRGG